MSEWPFRILGRRVHDDVGTELERTLDPRRGEGVVHDDQDPALARDLGDGGDIDQLQQSDWSASRSRSCASSDRIAAASGAWDPRGRRKLKSRFAERRRTRSNRRKRAAVEVVHRDDVVARSRAVRAASRSPPCPEAKAKPRVPPSRSAMQRSYAHARRVLRARVLVALVHAGALLRVSRGRVDRRHHGAGRRVRRLPAVDGAGGESKRLLRVFHRCLSAPRSSGGAGN